MPRSFVCMIAPDKKRAAEREDEELDEEATKDPWLRQAAEDSARAAAGEGGADIASHFSTHNGKKALVSSTAVFDGDDAAPVFDQHRARLTLLKHMRPGETVMKAVKRLGSHAGGAGAGAAGAPGVQKVTKMKNVRSKPKEGATGAATGATTAADAAAEKERKAAFEELTEAAQGFIGAAYLGQFCACAAC